MDRIDELDFGCSAQMFKPTITEDKFYILISGKQGGAARLSEKDLERCLRLFKKPGSNQMNTNPRCVHAIDEHTCDATNLTTKNPYIRCFRACFMFELRPSG